MTDKLFWFSKIGTKDSFSRLAESFLPILKKDYELFTIVPPNLVLDKENNELFDKVLRMGDDINSNIDGKKINTSIQEISNGDQTPTLDLKIKYTTLQVLMFCKEFNVNTLLITMGVFEADCFMHIINQLRKTMTVDIFNKDFNVVLYVPFDYIPTHDTIKDLITADTVLTTMPFIVTKLEKMAKERKAFEHSNGNSEFTVPKFGFVGHGSSNSFSMLTNKTKVRSILNATRGRFWNSPEEISETDLIILNANIYDSRKRIEATVEAFNDLVQKYTGQRKLKLWLHGGLVSGVTELIAKLPNLESRIISSSKVSNSELSLIYNSCQIGLQTSWGEGWSLTNCEHAMTGALQVVPDFLACGFHFSNGRGILVPVTEVLDTNEANTKVTIGVPKHDEVVKALEKAIEKNYDPKPTIEYLNKYTWESETRNLVNGLKC
jgi:hypothetical protein